MRINRYLSRCGLGSRRKVETLVTSGRIFVNGKKIISLSTEIDPDVDIVEFQGKKVNLPKRVYLMLNKPEGYTVTKSDKYAKKNVYELLPQIDGLFAVGRLDRESSGLLLLTNDGNFGQNIIHPSKEIEKEYVIKTKREIEQKEIELLYKGVSIDGVKVAAKKIQKIKHFKYRIIITEGRKRQIRKMLEVVNNKVIALKRVRIGSIILDIESGKYRALTPKELEPYVKN